MNENIKERVIREYLSNPTPSYLPCGCVGPKNNEPKCPCVMQRCVNIDNNWYEVLEKRSGDGITFEVVEL